jgi:large conductance mechanosensitive channel
LSGQGYASLAAAKEAGAATLNYGVFISAIVDFIIVALVLFLVLRQMNRLHRKPAEVPAMPTTKVCPFCLLTIPLKAVRCPHCTSELKS